MSLYGMANVRRYWNSNTRIPQTADVLTRDEFESVKNCLHFADNDLYGPNSKRDFKFASIVENFNSVANNIPIFDGFFSVDEQMIPTKTKKTSLRQYIPSKPKKWGFKVFLLTTSDGIIHNAEFYTGAEQKKRYGNWCRRVRCFAACRGFTQTSELQTFFRQLVC